MILNNKFLFYAPANDITAIFFFFSVLPCLKYMLNVNCYYVCTRHVGLYQVYEINDDWIDWLIDWLIDW